MLTSVIIVLFKIAYLTDIISLRRKQQLHEDTNNVCFNK